MALKALFPTQVWISQMQARGASRLNDRLASEAYAFRELDRHGQQWSQENYDAGYTSYGSITDLPYRSPSFATLKRFLDAEVKKYLKALKIQPHSGRIELSSCWVNIMGRHCHHSFHLHPLSVISGTYYVRVPRGSGAFKIEDPRLSAFMGRPSQENPFWSFEPKPGALLLFESWLRHEVPANRSDEDRVSVSFNYDWLR
ncbi:MAG: TIGR02466 family protein [Oligoflexia bacterium]|jgi:uncharacterized protein (TIGR02466 family)